MGDIADGLIDGTFDSITGEYLGEGHGYPRSNEWDNDFKHNHVKGVKKFLSGKQIYNTFQHDYCMKYLRVLHNKEYKGGLSWIKIGNTLQDDWGAFVEYVKNNPLNNICSCDNPKIHTDENGINYCKKCKVEVEIITPKK